jgi:hypothetical protein
MESFREIEQTLWEMVRFLALPTKGRDNDSVLHELVRLDYIDDNTVKLFESLRDARNRLIWCAWIGLFRSRAGLEAEILGLAAARSVLTCHYEGLSHAQWPKHKLEYAPS